MNPRLVSRFSNFIFYAKAGKVHQNILIGFLSQLGRPTMIDIPAKSQLYVFPGRRLSCPQMGGHRQF